jgi:hypothetical protein
MFNLLVINEFKLVIIVYDALALNPWKRKDCTRFFPECAAPPRKRIE